MSTAFPRYTRSNIAFAFSSPVLASPDFYSIASPFEFFSFAAVLLFGADKAANRSSSNYFFIYCPSSASSAFFFADTSTLSDFLFL